MATEQPQTTRKALLTALTASVVTASVLFTTWRVFANQNAILTPTTVSTVSSEPLSPQQDNGGIPTRPSDLAPDPNEVSAYEESAYRNKKSEEHEREEHSAKKDRSHKKHHEKGRKHHDDD